MSLCLKLVLLGVLVVVPAGAAEDAETKVECYKNCVIFDKITRADKEVELTDEQKKCADALKGDCDAGQVCKIYNFAGTSKVNDTKANAMVEVKIEARMANCGAKDKPAEVFCNSTTISDDITVVYDETELVFSKTACSDINDCTESCLEMKASANGQYLSAALLSIIAMARLF
eukprot:sb/3472038/